MTNVWFVGRGSRTISWQEWSGYGISADTISWNARNGWSVPEDIFSEDQLNVLENDNEFLLGQTGPRFAPVPFLTGEFTESAYAYYARIVKIYEDLIEQGVIVNNIEQLEGISDIGLAIAQASDAAEVRNLINIENLVAPVRFSGPVAVLGVTGQDRANGDRTLIQARMRVASAPVGSSLVAVVQHYDGGSWFNIGTLTITSGSVVESVIELDQSQVTGNLVRLNITSVGSTTAAQGLVVDVLVTNG